MLPELPRLRRSTTILVRPSGTVQLGWDPEHALLLTPPEGVDPETLAELLHRLDGTLDSDHAREAARQHGLDNIEFASLLGDLDAAGLLEPAVEVRRSATVRVCGRGPLSDAIWAGLRRLGIPTTRSGAGGTGSTADFMVLADNLIVDRGLINTLNSARLPHMQVRMRDGRGVVGPMVFPGETSCLNCADLFRAEHDAEWPHLAAQLTGRVGYAPPAMVTATAALALDQIEAVCSHSPVRLPSTANATLELDFDAHRLAHRPWPRHHACSCQ